MARQGVFLVEPGLKDRFTAGFLGGLVSGVAMNVIDHIFFALNYAQIRYLEWAGHIIYGRAPAGTGELATAQGVQLFFAGILGANIG